MQLLHKPKIRIRYRPFTLDVRHSVHRRHSVGRHQEGRDDAHTPADALCTVHNDARVRGAVQRIADEGRCGGQVRRELGEGQVLDADVQSHGLRGELRGRGPHDSVAGCGEDVRDAV